MSGSPPNVKTPVVIADVARKISSDHGLEIQVLGQVLWDGGRTDAWHLFGVREWNVGEGKGMVTIED